MLRLIVSHSPLALGRRSVVPMGPQTNVLTSPPASPTHVAGHQRHDHEPSEHDDGNVPAHRPQFAFCRLALPFLGPPVCIWLAVRLVLGYWWLNAGYQKIWGSEKAAFWFGGGAGVKGFATAGVMGSATRQERSQLRLVGWLPSQLRDS